MQVFYIRDISGKICSLDEKESRHCIKVLRLKKGDEVKMIDGKGNLFSGRIADADPGRCNIEVTHITNDFENRDYRLHIAISPLKNPDRFELFIEKSVEIGIDEITPIICSRTEKPGIRHERVSSLIISAMKQSLKAKDTVLNKTVSFNEFGCIKTFLDISFSTQIVFGRGCGFMWSFKKNIAPISTTTNPIASLFFILFLVLST